MKFLLDQALGEGNRDYINFDTSDIPSVQKLDEQIVIGLREFNHCLEISSLRELIKFIDRVNEIIIIKSDNDSGDYRYIATVYNGFIE